MTKTKEIEVLENQIIALKNRNVIALGENEAFALTDDSGQVKAFKKVLALSTKEGTLVKIGYSNTAPVIISAQGYEKWAEATGASVIFPKDVLVGSELKPNPFVERDEKNGRILAVHARAVAFKFSSMGLPQCCDWSTIFDVPSYRMIDLLAKAKKTPQAFKLLPNGMEPEIKNNETFAKYPFDEATSLWLNTAHKEVLDWFSSIINREKKAMDFAQTFARRNALKHLSGIQKAPAEQWSFSVLAWRPTGNNVVQWNAEQYTQLQTRVSDMIDGNSDFVSGDTKQLEVRKGVETVSQELDAEIKEDVNTDDPADIEQAENDSNDVGKHEQTEKEPEQKNAGKVVDAEFSKEEPEKKDLPKEILQVITLKENFKDEFDKACLALKIQTPPDEIIIEEMTVKEAKVIYKKAVEFID